ncbi:MAG: hypothetical protein ACP5HQ_05875 [Thermoprotei archaeon]
MKITNVESKKILKFKGKELVIEEARNERGEKIITVRELTSAKLAKGDEDWQDDLSNVQRVSMSELSQEIRELLRRALKNSL